MRINYNFKQEMQKYFFREKNHVFFFNPLEPARKVSLSQIAAYLENISNFTESDKIENLVKMMACDTGIVSKVIKGERLLGPLQLNTFCRLLKLNSSQEYRLHQAIAQDCYVGKGGKINLIISDELFSSVHLNLKQVYAFKLGGQPQQAISTAKAIEPKLAQWAYSKTFFKDDIVKMWAYSIYEDYQSFSQIALPYELRPAILAVSKKLEKIAKELENEEVFNLREQIYAETHFLWGKVHLEDGNITLARINFITALDNINITLQRLVDYSHPDREDRYLVLLALQTLTLAYLGEKTKYEKLAQLVEKHIENRRYIYDDSACDIMLSIAQAYLLHKNEHVFSILGGIEKLYAKTLAHIGTRPLLFVKFIGLKLALVDMLQQNDKDNLYSIGLNALERAKEHKFHQQTQELEKLLNNLRGDVKTSHSEWSTGSISMLKRI